MNSKSRELQNKFVDALMLIPITTSFSGRSTLLDGLPNIALNRSEVNARLDLNQIISQLFNVGRDRRSGVRPLIMVAENALRYINGWEGDLSIKLQDIIRDLERFYGGETQTDELPLIDPEKLLFKGRDERLPFFFIQNALDISKSIARLKVPRIFNGKYKEGDNAFGTGWIIAPGILITNYHVIEARNRLEAPATHEDFVKQAENITAWFDYLQEGGSYFECKKSKLIASSQELDYAMIRLEEGEKILDRNPLKIIAKKPDLKRGYRLNIVQHSGGGPLIYAIRNNFYVGNGNTTNYLRYLTDTEGGASGSPVFNDYWQVVGLHHAATRIPCEYYANLPQERYALLPSEVISGQVITYHNEGIAIHAILNDLPLDLRQIILM